LFQLFFFNYIAIQSTYTMCEKDYLQDFTKSKSNLNTPAKLNLLSGLSGILIGIYAFIGAFVGNYLINSYQNNENSIALLPISFFEILLAGVALIILLLSLITAFLLARKKAKNNNENYIIEIKRLLKRFIVPFITGGLFSIILYQYNLIGLILPCTLIFYGIACISVSKFRFGNIYYLGITNIIIGLIATQFIEFSLHFWALGFGVTHIIYGLLPNKSDGE